MSDHRGSIRRKPLKAGVAVRVGIETLNSE